MEDSKFAIRHYLIKANDICARLNYGKISETSEVARNGYLAAGTSTIYPSFRVPFYAWWYPVANREVMMVYTPTTSRRYHVGQPGMNSGKNEYKLCNVYFMTDRKSLPSLRSLLPTERTVNKM